MTKKLYYDDAYIKTFRATVKSSDKTKRGYDIILDETAFFAEGGGQMADRGYINGIEVLDVQEHGEEIVHTLKSELLVGEEITGEIDWAYRYRNMQEHSGEHIFSGTVHRLFTARNIGFHMSDTDITLDFNEEFSAEDLAKIELEANKSIYDNVEIVTRIYNDEDSVKFNYRSKKELGENVRIVDVLGVDVCACCAPHVKRTGEVGMIKIIEAMRHRGGMRIVVKCGIDALNHYNELLENTKKISHLLSAKLDKVPDSVERVYNENLVLKQKISKLNEEMLVSKIEKTEISGTVCVFETDMEIPIIREYVNGLLKNGADTVAVFSGSEGKYSYVIGSKTVDLKAAAKDLNAKIKGKGGGSAIMIQGNCVSDIETIKSAINNIN